MGMLPQLQDYEPGKAQQLQAKHKEASQEAAQQRLLQSSFLQGTQCPRQSMHHKTWGFSMC